MRGDGIRDETAAHSHSLPVSSSRSLPQETGIVSGGHRYTYGEFGERCERLAAGLRAEGIQPGDRVAFLSYNNNQLLEGYYGAPLLRAIAMPLNVRLRRRNWCKF